MKRPIVAIFLLLSSLVFAELIPAHRLRTWVPGTDVGVVGGIAQYQPGGASARTNLLNVVTSYGADNTGATDASTAIQNAINAATTNDVVYLPTGVYRLDSGLTIGGTKDSITIRGAFDFALSRSENTIGTGTKTFEVEAGLGYQAGDGIWIWVWDRDNVKISSITRSGTTATVTTVPPHGFSTGQLIAIEGAGESAYNIGAIVTVTGANTFTYTVAGSPSTPASGVFLRCKVTSSNPVASITRSGTTATVTTANPHLLTNGEITYIAGADQSEYNLTTSNIFGSNPITVTSPTTFTYQVSGSPATPATGTILIGTCGPVGVGFGPLYYMAGTVTSYSGTTLTVSISTTRGTGCKFSMWKIGGAVLDLRANAAAVYVGSAADSYWVQDIYTATLPDVTGSPVAGATSITVSDGSNFSNGQMLQIALANNYDPNTGEVGDNSMALNAAGYTYSTRQTLTLVSKSGNTFTISPGLMFDLPAARAPKIANETLARTAENVGIENLTVLGHNSSYTGGPIAFSVARNCWAYRVSVHATDADFFGGVATKNIEINSCWGSHRRVSGTGGRGLGFSQSADFLVVNSILMAGAPNTENVQDTRYAMIYNFSQGEIMNTNHNPWTRYALLEGNVSKGMQSDGYFGGESEQTQLRNWWTGYNYYTTDDEQILLNRWSYNFNVVGNVLGTPGYVNGGIFKGYPNIGNQNYEGTAEATAADFWIQLPGTSGPRTGVLTTRTDAENGVITLDTGNASDFQPPNAYNDTYNYTWIRWGAGVDFIAQLTTTYATNQLTVTKSGATLPPLSTAVEVWRGNSGYQELDLDVDGTIVQKGNYITVGSSGSQEANLGGDTIPDSYAYAAKPSWFGDALSWPPINPASPNLDDGWAVIPASYWYYYGELPAPSAEGSSATVTGTTTVTGTLTLP